ncbi:MAG: acetone carboxylase [Propionibacteriales bacterium]|nr:acetone carboxylase [Propionibacteriales bacterium]
MADELVCSAKGCTAAALHRIEWNNPKIHTPDRRKTWLACDEHEQSLRRFLDARGFYKETLPLQDGVTSE